MNEPNTPIALVPGDDALLRSVAQHVAGLPNVAVFESANALLWQARRAAPHVVVAALALPDMGGEDLLDILPLLSPAVRIVLCGDGTPELAHSLRTTGGRLVLNTAAPEARLDQIYLAIGIAPPTPETTVAPAPSHDSIPSCRRGARIISVGQRTAIKQLLSGLMREAGAQFVLLSDAVGMPLIELGEPPPLKIATLGPLLAPAFFTAAEFARQLEEDAPQSFYLYEGLRFNVYAFTIAGSAILTLVVDQTRHSGKPAPVWAITKQVGSHLQKLLNS